MWIVLMSPFSWQCQNLCRLSLAFILDWRVVSRCVFWDIRLMVCWMTCYPNYCLMSIKRFRSEIWHPTSASFLYPPIIGNASRLLFVRAFALASGAKWNKLRCELLALQSVRVNICHLICSDFNLAISVLSWWSEEKKIGLSAISVLRIFRGRTDGCFELYAGKIVWVAGYTVRKLSNE